MGKKLTILVLLLALCYIGKAQFITGKELLDANTIYYRNKVYVYGYRQINHSLAFTCYSYNTALVSTDSSTFDLGKHTPSDFLEITTDTAHNMLSFFFQLADHKNTLNSLHYNEKLALINSVKDYDAARIGSITAFENETYYYANTLYVLKAEQDTAEKQFYLNKYILKDATKPFEYNFLWQFAFDRNYIHRATVLYADSNDVMVYANVNDGPKKGQWILRLKASNGQLIKGTKLSSKIDGRLWLVSNSLFDTKNRSITVAGSIYQAEQLDFKNTKSNFTTLYKTNTLFIATVDSSGEIAQRVEKPLALPLQTKVGKHLRSFHTKIREFTKNPQNGFDMWIDIYEMSRENVLCYYSSWYLNLVPDDVDYTVTNFPFYLPATYIPDLISFTQGDNYGKFEMKNISEYDFFKYNEKLNSIIVSTAINDGNPYYILKKTNILNSTKTYYYIFKGAKTTEKKILLKAEQGQKAALYPVTKTTYISFLSNTSKTGFELKLNTL